MTLIRRLAGLAILALPLVAFAEEPRVVLEVERDSYAHPADIKPVLINRGTIPVFLSSLHPPASAYLEFQQADGSWSPVESPITCSNVDDVNRVIRVAPGQSFEPTVLWEFADGIFRESLKLGSPEEYPFEGVFRLRVHYATQLWTAMRSPDRVLRVYSKPFTLRKDMGWSRFR